MEVEVFVSRTLELLQEEREAEIEETRSVDTIRTQPRNGKKLSKEL